MYGRDARLPTETAHSQPTTPYQVNDQDYKTGLVSHLSDAWTLAQDNVAKAQAKQNRNYDRSAKEPTLQKGDRVMVRMPGEIKGKSWKFARPYHGPYRVVPVTPTNAEVVLVDRLNDDPILVLQIRPCYEELPDISWTGNSGAKAQKKKKDLDAQKPEKEKKEITYRGLTTRSMSRKEV